ncbi:hypothetical protein I4U23_005529 [Adineta vaga]|nr:hypothetical protein I4U23_005529 [Adineta vaga]
MKECEKNSQLGWNFYCSLTKTCISYYRLCIDHCPNREDDFLCSIRQVNQSKPCGIQCNERIECPNGEDEYWCDYKMERPRFYFYQYRRSKRTTIQRNRLERISEKKLSKLDEQRKYVFYCNRGLVLKDYYKQLVCLCSPTYYGDKCQFYNDRLTILTHLDLTNSSFMISNTNEIVLSVIVFFLYEQTSIIDSNLFYVYPKFERDFPKKHRFMFSYPRSNVFLKNRFQRYFNRTDINNHQPFNLVNSCSNNNCNLNSICQPLVNRKNSFICLCKSGFYGENCTKFHSKCQNACSSNAICRYNENNRPVCICPLGYFGRSCSLRGVPLATAEKIYKDFQTVTDRHNKMDKREFRRLYKEMYLGSQSGNNIAPFLSDHDLDKMSDHVFETYDFDGSGKLTFEEFAEIYLMLNHYGGTNPNGTTRKEKFNYILDQYDDPTPGYISREHGQQVFNRLNNYQTLANWNKASTNPSTTTTTWEQHWKNLDDGTGRVPRDKFVDYVTNSNEYKNHFGL